MNLNKTLVILTPGFPENEADSTCLPAQQVFVKALKYTYPLLQIVILSFQYPFHHESYLWNGISVVPFNGKNKGKLSRLRVWINVFMRLKKITRENNVIGIFNFWCSECALVGKYFSKYSGVKQCSWISGQDAGKQNKFIKFICPHNNELVAMSAFLAKEFYRNHAVLPGMIIPNGIDTGEFEVAAVTKIIDVCAVGSLIKLKQYDLFVKIIHQLKEHLPAINAVIYGKGPEEQTLQSGINKYQLKNNILLGGEISHPEVLQKMRQSRVFLHPSSYEGCSSVCLEALYAGAHVISFTDPGFGKIAHWHVVSSPEEMFDKALDILISTDVDYSPVLVYSMNDSAKAVMELFEPIASMKKAGQRLL